MAFRSPPNLGRIDFPHTTTIRLTPSQWRWLKQMEHRDNASDCIRQLIEAAMLKDAAGKTSRRSTTDE